MKLVHLAFPSSRRLILIAACLALGTQACLTALGAADNWPQFRGSNASGVSETAKPPVKIGPTEGVAWSIDVPFSPSSPTVWGERIFLTTFQDGQVETRAHSAMDGKLLWTRRLKPEQIEDFHISDGSPAASTPATDGERVVSYFGSFGVICHDVRGRELWRHPLPLALSGGRYGTGASPIIAGDKVIVNLDQFMNSSVLALSLKTGDVLWESPRPEFRGGFGTPIIWRNEGREELVVPGSLMLKGYELSTGKERWSIGGVASFVCTTPVTGGGLLYFGAWSPGKADSSVPMEWPQFLAQYDRNKDGRVLLSEFDPQTRDYVRGLDLDRDNELTEKDLATFREVAAKADNVLIGVRPGGTGNITQTHVAWSYKRGLPYVPSPIFYDGRVYYVKDGGMMSSVDAKTGQPHYYQERLGAQGNYYASPVAADGRIYVASLPGVVTVVKAGGDAPEILHQADFRNRILATPALVGKRLYLRTEKKLYAFGVD